MSGIHRKAGRGGRKGDAPLETLAPAASWPCRPWAHGAGIAAIVAFAGAMLAWTWGTWPDIVIDFGRELYVPWRLSLGQTLYTDIAFFNGPLSQYFNSLVFRLFGTGFWVLVACNLVILAGLIVLLHAVLRRVSTWWTATVACLVFVGLFAFAQFTVMSNYNYVCPYSHEITHGIVLCLGMTACLWGVGRRPRLMAALAGAMLGMVFLTKSELFLAAAASAGVTLALTFWRGGFGLGRMAEILGVFLGSALAPPLVAFALLCLAMPAHQAAAGMLSPFPTATYKELSALVYYRGVMGTDDVPGNLALLLRWTGYYAALLAPGALLALACRKTQRPYLAWVVFALVALFFVCIWQEIKWSDMARPLPLVMLVILVVLAMEYLRCGQDAQRRGELIPRLSLAVLGAALLVKIVLNTHITHYGFALAMPATLVFVVALWDWIPAAITRCGGTGAIFRGGVLAVLLAAAAFHLHRQAEIIDHRTVIVKDNDRDAIWTNQRGTYVNDALAEIHAHAQAGQTLAVFPEGVMINYLSRMPNPTGYINFMPPEMILFGQQRMLEAFESRPPDFVLLMVANMDIYGYRGFGLDYGLELFHWLDRNYRPIASASPESFAQRGFVLLERAIAASAPAWAR